MKTIIRHARVFNPGAKQDQIADVMIVGSTITEINESIFDAEANVIDADGLWLMPGLVDIHVHLREPGGEVKETIESGTKAAAAGGVTSVVCMANTNPPIDNKTGVDFIFERVQKTGSARVYPVGTVTKRMEGKEISPIGEMVQAGAIAISDDGKGIMDSLVMRRAMEYSTIFKIPILSHSEDHALTAGGSLNEGRMSMTLGMIGCPKEAEIIQTARDMILAQKTGAHIHIQHVSNAESVDLIRFYKAKGVHVTAEATPHHLVLTEDAVDRFNTNAKMNPPLRTQEDQDALYEGLKDGTLDCIATDHAPHTPAEKSQSFPEAPFGIIGLETLLPLTLGPIQERLGFDLLELLQLVTNKPAKLMHIQGGWLEIGSPADLTLWNPEPVVEYDVNQSHSKSRNSPFHGWKMNGCVEATFVAGKLVYTKSERMAAESPTHSRNS